MIIQPSGCQKGRVFRSRNRILISTSARTEFTDFWLFFLCPQDIFVVVDVAVLQHRINPFIPSHLRQIFSWPVLEVYRLSDIHPLLTAARLDAQQSRLHVRKSAAAHISHWSLVEDHSGPLPTAPCYGKRKAIKP